VTPRILAVLGGTDSLAGEVARQAAAAGHIVNVLAMTRPDGDVPAAVTYIDGDVHDPASVDRTIAPSDAVISTLLQGRRELRDLVTRAVADILAAMDRHDLSRVVLLASLALRTPGDAPTAEQQVRRMLSRLDLAGGARHEEKQVGLLAASDADWTVVRTPRITDRPPTGRYRVGALDAGTGREIGSADLAAFLIECAVRDVYIREMPVISY
jgi:putative NADH-flavin reductase